MKKAAICASILFAFFAAGTFSADIEAINKPPQQSKEELYQDIFVSFLMPHIDYAIHDYYTRHLHISPTVYPYQVSVISAERVGGYRSFDFLVKVQTDAVVGPHITVGIDRITFHILVNGQVEMKKFEHVRSFELPPHYQHIKKRPQ